MLKGFHKYAIAFIVIFMITFVGGLSAQGTQTGYATYTIKQNDNLWRIIDHKCGVSEGPKWPNYLALSQNVSLQDEWRRFTTKTGDPGWLVYATEKITLPTDKCNLKSDLLIPETTPVAAATPVGLTLADIDKLLDKKLAGVNGTHVPWWMWALLALLVVAVVYLISHWANHNTQERRDGEHRRREDELHALTYDALTLVIANSDRALTRADAHIASLQYENDLLIEMMGDDEFPTNTGATDDMPTGMRSMSFGDNCTVNLTLGANSPATQTATTREQEFAS